jgi:predicted metal-binding membrane protein
VSTPVATHPERDRQRRLGGVPFAHLVVPGTALIVVAALAWVLTVRQADGMGHAPGTMGMALPAFLGMWTAMMAAMMFPSVATLAVIWVRSINQQTTGLTRGRRLVSFLAGYLISWAGYGVLAYAALLGTDHLIDTAPDGARWLGVAVFAVAGAYQLTSLKDACLTHCRSPLGQVVHYGNYRGRLRDLRVGLHHGAYCVGCCWGLMLVLVAVGVMNIPVMVAIAAAIFAEKLWSRGQWLSKLIGVGLLLLATAMPFHPNLAPALHHRGGTDLQMDPGMRM